MGTIKTILLTGATGYLGSNLAGALVSAGYNIVILKRSSSDTKRLAAILDKIKSYDIDADGCTEAFRDNNIDCVLHTAASYGRKGETLADIYQANLLFGVNLVDNCIKLGVKYFINTGTSLPETLNVYALSKAQFSALLKLQSAIKTINVELQYFYGPGDDATKFITFILSKALSATPSIDLSAGTQFRDFIYIDDVIKAYLLMIRHIEGQEIPYLNIPLGSGTPYTLKEIVEKIKVLAQSNINLNFGAVPMREGDVMYAKADITLLQSLGWQPEYDINTGLTKTITTEKSLIA